MQRSIRVRPIPRRRAAGSTNSARLVPRDAEDRARPLPVELRDPAGLALRVVARRKSGDDLGDEALEGDVPAVLGGVHRAVALNDPAEIAGAIGETKGDAGRAHAAYIL
jgi:hypothetical protein